MSYALTQLGLQSAYTLGANICQPYTCCYSVRVDVRGSHALSCKRSSGRLIRHNHLNEIIHRSLNRARLPATREPHGLLRVDGKCPDGLTLIPWRKGRCLMWDVTVADTTAASYLAATATVAKSAAEFAPVHKEMKYAELSNSYHFFPITIELHGPLSNNAKSFFLFRSRSAYYNIYVRRQGNKFSFSTNLRIVTKIQCCLCL